MSTFRLAMHPASEGDALILTWGDATNLRHALIDLGRTGDYRALKPQLKQIANFELFIITHIDADHIEGVVPLLKEADLPFSAKHVWFNARVQLEAAAERMPPKERERLGAAQAEKVTDGIVKSGWAWNAHFRSGVVSTDSPEARAPLALAGGLTVTLLSPSDPKLSELLPVWDAELMKASLRTTDPDEVAIALMEGREHLGMTNVEALAAQRFKMDTTRPNGASIAFIAQFAGKRVLLAADTHPDIVEASLRGLGASEATPYRIDCLKVSHHGSKANTSPTLLKIIDCSCFAFSTDGTRHGHPDAETIARILKSDSKRKKMLIFNFSQDNNTIWNNAALKQRYNYDCRFPPPGKKGIEFDI